MKRVFLVVIASLVATAWLFCDVVTSPTGHQYNPMYNQCESFTTIQRELQVEYQNGALSYTPISNVVLSPYDLSSIVVSHDDQSAFASINDAITYLKEYCASSFYYGEPIRIRVEAGQYPENIDLSPLTNLNVTSFTLEGIGEVIINGEITLCCPVGTLLSEAEYVIKDLQITNATRGIKFADAWDDYATENNPHVRLTIDNCDIYGCGVIVDSSVLGSFYAAGVHFEGAGVIKNCTFTDNETYTLNSEYASRCKSGALYVLNNSNAAVEVTNNTFTNNKGSISGGIVLNGIGSISVSHNLFEHNVIEGYYHNEYQGNAISVYETGRADIHNNLLIDNLDLLLNGGVSVYLKNISDIQANTYPIEFVNNTIVNHLLANANIQTRSLSFNYLSNSTGCQDIVIRKRHPPIF